MHDYEKDRTDPPTARLSALLAHFDATPLEVFEAVRAAKPGAWSHSQVPADVAARIMSSKARTADLVQRVMPLIRADAKLAEHLVAHMDELTRLLEAVAGGSGDDVAQEAA